MAPQELQNLLKRGDWDAASNYTSILPHDKPLDGSILSLACRQSSPMPPPALLRNLFRHIASEHRIKGYNDASADMRKRNTQSSFFSRGAEVLQRQLTGCNNYFSAALEAWWEGQSDGVKITFGEYEEWGLTHREAMMMWAKPRPPQAPSPKKVIVMAIGELQHVV